MKKTNIRAVAWLLMLCLAVGLLPTAALAAYAETRIETVSVDATAPAAGGSPAQPAVAADAPYTIESYSWYETASVGSDVTIGGSMYGDDKFESSKIYRLSVKLRAEFGYAFHTALTSGRVNGAYRVKISKIDADEMTLMAWFGVLPSPSVAQIADIAVTGVTAPSAATKDPYDTARDVEETASRPDGTVLDVTYYEWKPAAEGERSDGWEYRGFGDRFTSGGTYGAKLELTADSAHAFSDAVTATVDGKTAIVLEQSEDLVSLFVPFADVEIKTLRISVDDWPAVGAAIRNTADNFDFYSSMYGCTLNATFQIEESDGTWRDVTSADSPYAQYERYRVKAVIHAADGFSFAASGTGSINGESGTTWDVTDGGKTLTLTRTCGKDDPVLSYTNWYDPSTYLYNVLPLRILTPADGVTPVDAEVGRPGETRRTEGLSTKYAGWFEVPYAGSTSNDAPLYDSTEKKFTKPFRNGNVYRLDVVLRADNDHQFIDTLALELYGTDGAQLTPAMTRQTADTTTRKEYSLWFEVGDVSYQKISTLTVTGPEPDADGKIDDSDPTKFVAAEAVSLSDIRYWEYSDELEFEATVKAGYYFAALGQLTATYNGYSASVSGVYWGDSRELVRVTFRVSTTKTPLTIANTSAITAAGKTYDGTTAVTLDISHATLDGVDAAHPDVQLAAATAAFASPDAGKNVAVNITGLFTLTGADAGRYTLTQPDLTGLTATISPCTVVADTTNKTQTVYTGEGTFDGAHFAGVEIGGAPEAATGTVTYTIGDGTEAKTAGEVTAYLKTLKAGDTADIHYNYRGTGNYDGASGSGIIKITIADRPAAPVTPAQPKPAETTCPKDATCPLAKFTDVPADAWYHDGLHYCVEHGLLNGTGESTFSPSRTMTRGMVVTVLYRLAGSPAPKNADGFADVPAGSYCDAATRWAAENGIALGFADGSFRPEQPVSRAQLAAILCRYAKNAGIDVTDAADLSAFPDAALVGAWARDALGWANGCGLILGRADGRLDPTGDASRDQMAMILYRFCKTVLGK